MKPLDLQTLCRLAAGDLRGVGSVVPRRVVSDSRQVGQGDLFVALRGERFDGHEYLPQVASAGAAAALVQRGRAMPGLACIEVDDVLGGLQRLAAGYRQLLKPLLIGITGSNGKTSTKDFLAAIMAQQMPTRATLGNLYNHIGLPLTLLSLEEQERCAVVEMGMNHAGEIRALCDIARPDAAIITHIGVAHIEHLGSRDAIAWEKATLAAQVPESGVVVLNADDDYSGKIARHCQGRVLLAGLAATAGVRVLDAECSEKGSRFVLDFEGRRQVCELPLPGAHMMGNAALAAAMGWAQGLHPEQIAQALAGVSITPGRMQWRSVRGLRFLDDSYNANPDSACAALAALMALKGAGRRIAVLGRMGELGAFEQAGHEQVGRMAAQCGVDALLSVGDSPALQQLGEAAKAAGLACWQHFGTHDEAVQWLRANTAAGDAVLLKGSRAAAMETIFSRYQAS